MSSAMVEHESRPYDGILLALIELREGGEAWRSWRELILCLLLLSLLPCDCYGKKKFIRHKSSGLKTIKTSYDHFIIFLNDWIQSCAFH